MRPTVLLLALVAGLLTVAGPAGAQHKYGWTISDNPADPLSNTGLATNQVKDLYLWLYCSEGDGVSAAEFDIRADGIVHLGTTAESPYLNAGSAESLLLALGGCPEGPVVVARLLVLDAPGTICMAPSLDNNRQVSVDCSLDPRTWNIDWVGYNSRGGDPCQGGTLCDANLTVSTWATVKGMYRDQ